MRFLTLFAAMFGLSLIGALAAALSAAPTLDVAGLTSGARAALACAEAIAPNPVTLGCEAGVNEGRLMLLSLAVTAGAIGLVAFAWIASLLLGLQRQLLAFGFGLAALACMVTAALLTLGHMGLIGGSLAVLAGRFTGLDDQAVLIAAGAVAGLGVAALAPALLALFRSSPMYIAGAPISLYEFPRLGLIIRDVSKTLKSRMPDNYLIGLQPSFFATSARIQTPYLRGPLKGDTLFLSLPLMQQMTEGELRAVIGHELGHFSGGDVAFSRRFTPAFGAMLNAADALGDESKRVRRILAWPVRRLIEEAATPFNLVRLRIGRGREHRADESGLKVSSAPDMAYALLKSSVLSSVWHDHMRDSIDHGMRGRFSRNLVRNFADRVRLDFDREKLGPLVRFAFGETVKHPTDTHPPTEDRITAAGLNLVEISEGAGLADRFFNARKVTDGLDNMRPLEEALTSLHYHLYSELWPGENDAHDIGEVFNALLCDILALMVTIDGKVDDRELERAEAKSRAVFGDFDADTFRDRCQHPDSIPPLDQMIAFAGKLLKPTGVDSLKSVLRQIAEADGEIEPRELAMLEQIEATLVSSPE